MRLPRHLIVASSLAASALAASAFALTGCSATLGDGAEDQIGSTADGDTALALISSTGEQGILRAGETLSIQSSALGTLLPETIYRAQVMRGSALISESDVLTDPQGGVLLSAVLYDVGEDGRVAPGDSLNVQLTDFFGDVHARTIVRLDAPPSLQVSGWNVAEVAPPHVFAADATGTPQNAFAVGGAGAGEVVGPIYVAGDGFPEEVAGRQVNVYIAKDADEWRDQALPQAGDEAHVVGPVPVNVREDGSLEPTALLTPSLSQVGIYDILVDVDMDGRFEWSFSAKDGADGLAKVGFTVQYSAEWLAQRTSSHILVNIAYNSHQRGDGQWANEFQENDPVFLYLNPPVMHTYHFKVTKWIVDHQDFDQFWNNPAMANDAGDVCFSEHSTVSMAIITQTGCTNSSPTCFGPVPIGDSEGPGTDGYRSASFDVVFDRNGDGCYTPGEDMLDIISNDTGGDLVTVEDFLALPASQRVGLTVRGR